LYVNGRTQGLIGSLGYLTLPTKNGELKLSIKADGCTPWDTTIVVPPGTDKLTVGWRGPGC
jgi:hypothetical protein